MPIYSIFNSNGDSIFNKEYEKLNSFITKQNKILFQVKKDNKYGVVDIEGQEIISPIYDAISYLKFGETVNYYGVELNNKIGYINEAGLNIVDIKYDKQYSFPEFENGLILLKRNSKNYFINEKGEVVLELKAGEVENFTNELALIKNDNKYGYINILGDEIIECIYSEAYSFLDNFPIAFVKLKGFWGIIDKSNNVIVDFIYDQINTRNNEEILIVKKDKLFGLLHPMKGKNIANCIYKEIISPTDNIFIVKKDKTWGVINFFDVELIPFEYDEIKFSSKTNKLFARKKKKWNIINLTNLNESELICEEVYTLNESLLVKQKGIYSIIDDTNVKSLDLDEIIEVKDEKIIFKKNNKFGLISDTSQIAIAVDYDELNFNPFIIQNSLSKNLFIVKKDNYYGVINQKNEIICNIQYDKVEIREGGILYKQNALWGFQTSTNNFASETIFKNINVQLINNEVFFICENENVDKLNTEYFIHRDDTKSNTFSVVVLRRTFKEIEYVVALGRIGGGLYGDIISKFKNIQNWDVTKGVFSTDLYADNWEFEYENQLKSTISAKIEPEDKKIFESIIDELFLKFVFSEDDSDEYFLRNEALSKLGKSTFVASSATWAYKNLSKHWGLNYSW